MQNLFARSLEYIILYLRRPLVLANHQAKLDAREDCTVNFCRQVYVPIESKTYNRPAGKPRCWTLYTIVNEVESV